MPFRLDSVLLPFIFKSTSLSVKKSFHILGANYINVFVVHDSSLLTFFLEKVKKKANLDNLVIRVKVLA